MEELVSNALKIFVSLQAPWRKEGFQEWGADFVGLCKMGKCVIRNLLTPGDLRWSLFLATPQNLRPNKLPQLFPRPRDFYYARQLEILPRPRTFFENPS